MKSPLFALPLVALVAITSRAQPPAPSEPAIAKVNGVVIPKRVFDDELDKITARGTTIPAERIARVADNILKRLVEEEVVAQAVKRAKIVVPQRDIDEGLRDYKERFQSEAQFNNYLTHGKVTLESIIKRIRDRRALEMLLAPRLKVTRAEARAFYDENERFYTEKAGIHAGHILIKLPEEGATAEQLSAANERVQQAIAALAAGEDFNKVAERMTEGPTKDGDLGWFGEGRMVEEFEDVAFKMKVGEVSKPVRTRFGIHIIKLFARREDRKLPFAEVEAQVIKSIQNKRILAERRILLDQLMKTAKVEKFMPPEYQVPPDLAPMDGDVPESESE